MRQARAPRRDEGGQKQAKKKNGSPRMVQSYPMIVEERMLMKNGWLKGDDFVNHCVSKKSQTPERLSSSSSLQD